MTLPATTKSSLYFGHAFGRLILFSLFYLLSNTLDPMVISYAGIGVAKQPKTVCIA